MSSHKEHKFGGDWTETKLKMLRDYLKAYIQIFESNKYANHYNRIYLDAFAGTGYRTENPEGIDSHLFSELHQPEKKLLDGSAAQVLKLNPGFHRYIFIEKDAERITSLNKLKDEYPQLSDRIQIEQQDANTFIQSWIQEVDWLKNRAVIFLDPYGMQVEWKTVESIASTKAIDLWLLFPFGSGVVRMLPRNRTPPQAWSDRLDRVFGSNEWIKFFYSEEIQENLFQEQEKTSKRTADFKQIGEYIIGRLKIVFREVATPCPLYNSQNNPLYLLCFAANNKTAKKIANDIILKKIKNG